MLAGSLFAEDYLLQGVKAQRGYGECAADAAAFGAWLSALLGGMGDPAALNEAQTEDLIVRPLLDRLGWSGLRVVQNAATRADIPDYVLFPDEEAYAHALPLASAERFKHAVAVADAKKWSIGLDQRGGGAGFNESPAGQVLRYMDRAAQRSARCRWGVLTNGRSWRLYWQGAGDRLARFFEVDLLAALQAPGAGVLPLFGIRADPAHALTLFLLFFRRRDFAVAHEAALNEGRLWETRVREDLAQTVFQTVYPGFVRALIAGDPQAPTSLDAAYLTEVREAALTLLYRLLFVLYAEDRDLLPRRDPRFDDYALSGLRDQVAQRRDMDDAFSARLDGMWRHATALFRLVDEGEDALGVPAYNGKLFAAARSPLLQRASIPDAVFAPLLDVLSRREEGGARKRINYRDLTVRELGSIYERLLEHAPVADPDAPQGVAVRLNPFARKGSGSYYTPDVLVKLIIERTLGPMVRERLQTFEAAVAHAGDGRLDPDNRRAWLTADDPATAILKLKVCDPAMGSGHFLVDLVDWLADQAFTAMGGAESKARDLGLDWRSPLGAELEALRTQLSREAAAHRWTIHPEQLTDAALVRRLVLKRCVFGVDKNPMAVELAKVALWLHTFTAGAPLSFLDHHLRCGDSLFGEWVDEVWREAAPHAGRARPSPISGSALFLFDAVERALSGENAMRGIETLSDGVMREVEESAALFAELEAHTATLKGFLDFRQALRWIEPQGEELIALRALLDGQFGDPLRIVSGLDPLTPPAGFDAETAEDEAGEGPEPISLPGHAGGRDFLRAKRLVARALALAAQERFLHWQVAFPGVWRGWRDARTGGFDAVIGNPPWDRMKMQEVEWFAERAPAIARQVRAADRKAAIAALRGRGDPLVLEYDLARIAAERAMGVARASGAYPLLSRGDINLYSLFVERAQALIASTGAAGLLTPSGVASDLTAAPFFKGLSTAGRVLTLFDFENRRGGGRGHFFADVDSRFKFCALVAGGVARTAEAAECGFFLQDAPAADDPRLFRMTAADFLRVNPNTGTAPIFRSARDAEITRAIYARLPVLVDRSSGAEVKAWPVRYATMFHMTNDSRLFWSEARLAAEGAYPIDGGRWAKGPREWLPLYSGRMIHLFNHRAAGIELNEENVYNAAVSDGADVTNLADPTWLPTPQFRVEPPSISWLYPQEWGLAFRDISRSTDIRTWIGAIVPRAGYGNTLPLIVANKEALPAIFANLASFACDYVVRQKSQSTHLNWYIVEQLPIVPHAAYARRIGETTAEALVRDHVLRLSYTAHDLADFARDMGHVEADGAVKPPFRWDEAQRRQLRARLDALYFILYGVTDRADVDHVLASFPIVERKDRAEHGVYLTAELIHWHMAALQAGDPGRDAPEAALIAAALRRRAA